MFDALLIANRGEIACRIIRTARRLGMRTIAVHSDVDNRALHTRMADDAYCIGEAPAKTSYLNMDMILEVAEQSGASAIHPGYGFLAENAEFADASGKRGFVFVGPTAQAIRAMGSKSAAKTLMEKAGVPVVPGYHGEAQDAETFAREAERIGYPVLLKASAGGGGKGLRVVETAGQLAAAAQAAAREADAAFADGRLLVEKYFARSRHVEIQVLADKHGNVVHLFERDCSIQRRHQKIIEEAPAPGLDETLRARLGKAAISAAKAVDYVGAGTVEFLLSENGDFHFMEMNTRLQVEHPVTEMITGLDLVEWQLRVAAGQHLAFGQEDLRVNGHAMEARLCAEDPAREFLPAMGRLERLTFPAEEDDVRIDSGMRTGDIITVHYDSLIAKVIVHGADRGAAIRRLRQVLSKIRLKGPACNLGFLSALAGHPAFATGDVETRFIERHRDQLFPAAGPVPARFIALACLWVVLDRQRRAAASPPHEATDDPHSPWRHTGGWRLNAPHRDVITLGHGGETVDVPVRIAEPDLILELPDGAVTANGKMDQAGDLEASIDGQRVRATVCLYQGGMTILSGGQCHLLVPGGVGGEKHAEGEFGHVNAPMPGRVVAVEVEAGKQVRRGETLLVLEAMKMEHAVTAPKDGMVARIEYSVGDQVEEGAELVIFDSADD